MANGADISRQRAVTTPIVSLLLFLQFGGLALAGLAPGTGMAGSRHDFSGRTAGSTSTGTCTFCHTPHRAARTRLAWNHTLPARDYTWGPTYTVTDGGTPLPTITQNWVGPSRFCLSCHDGSVAIGDVYWFNKQSWNGGSALDQTHATAHVRDPFTLEDFMKDMIGNHPVAAPYPYLQARNTYNGVTTGTNVRMDRYWPDPTSRSGGRIRLFRNVGSTVLAGAAAGITGIECTTCHGVHNEAGAVQKEFLLRSLDICKECHI